MQWKLQWGASPLVAARVQLSHSNLTCQAPEKKTVDAIFKVFGMTRPGLEPMTSRLYGRHFNHYNVLIITMMTFWNRLIVSIHKTGWWSKGSGYCFGFKSTSNIPSQVIELQKLKGLISLHYTLIPWIKIGKSVNFLCHWFDMDPIPYSLSYWVRFFYCIL